MKHLIWFILFFTQVAFAADVKISQLPLGVGATTGINDSFPYVSTATGVTKRLTLYDIANIPSIAAQFAALSGSPDFTGTVTAAGFIGPLTGNVTGNVTGNLTGNVTGNASTATALAANPTDCSADNYATTIAANGNLTCSTVTNAGLAGSIAASKLIGSDIATVGTITAGTWHGTVIAPTYGGTGQTTLALSYVALYETIATTLGDLIYGGASGTPTRLAGNTTTTPMFLKSLGSAGLATAPTWTQPACGDLSNAAASCSTDATNATNISSGTLGAARLPNPTSSTLGGVRSAAAVTNQWINSISTSGIPALSQPAFTDISGSVAAAQMPALTGDVTTVAGAVATTIGAGKVTNSMLAGSIAASKLVGSDIATVGTITSGTWTGTSIAAANGGTGQSSYTIGDILYASSSSALTKLAAGAAGTVLTSTGAGAAPVYSAATAVAVKNFLINGAFDWWQRGTTVTIANAASTYQADRWYVKNSLGTNGVITFSQVTGVTAGSIFGASVKITTAPTAAQVNGTELYQTVENLTTKTDLYNQSASFTVLVKALGNVNQVGVQFMYKTTEAKVDTTIGSEQTCTVNTSTFVSCSITNQALGTSMTASGVVGVRIRITAVSSGNTYDLNNGYVAEQAMGSVTAAPAAFIRAGGTVAGDLSLAQRYYEKSYSLTTNPGTVTTTNEVLMWGVGSTGRPYTTWPHKVQKRAITPTLTLYNTRTGASGLTNALWDQNTGSTDYTAQAGASDANWFVGVSGTAPVTAQLGFQYTVDAEI